MAAHSTNATTADSLERSLRSFSIQDSGGCRATTTTSISYAQKPETSSYCHHQDLITVDLNSETSLPYNWEQCLDLKTGEIYFINRSNGDKSRDDPREMPEYRGMYYYSDDEEDDNDADAVSCDYETDEEGSGSNVVKGVGTGGEVDEENVLVAAGCRSCLMYYMVPKQVNDCPKCNLQLLPLRHFSYYAT